jgi:hypothetical protein
VSISDARGWIIDELAGVRLRLLGVPCHAGHKPDWVENAGSSFVEHDLSSIVQLRDVLGKINLTSFRS